MMNDVYDTCKEKVAGVPNSHVVDGSMLKQRHAQRVLVWQIDALFHKVEST